MQTPPPMTLGNMRANGVRALAIHCLGRGCHHDAIFDVSRYGDNVPVPAFGPRMVCTTCGAIGADARPNWNERLPQEYRIIFQASVGKVRCGAVCGVVADM